MFLTFNVPAIISTIQQNRHWQIRRKFFCKPVLCYSLKTKRIEKLTRWQHGVSKHTQTEILMIEK